MEWSQVLGLLILCGTFLAYKEMTRKKPQELIESQQEIADLEKDIEFLKEKILDMTKQQNNIVEVWKERGNKYSANANNLQEELLKMHNIIADVVKSNFQNDALKKLLDMTNKEVKK